MSEDARSPSWWARMFGQKRPGDDDDVPGDLAPSRAIQDIPTPREEASSSASELSVAEAERRELQARMERLQAICETLRDALSIERDQRRTMEANHRALLDEREKLEIGIREALRDKQESQRQLEEAAVQLGQLHAELASATKRADTAEKASTASRRAGESARLQLDQSHRRIRDLQKELTARRAELEEAKRQRESSASLIGELRSGLAQMETEREELMSERDREKRDTAAKLARIRPQLEQAQAHARAIQAELEEQAKSTQRARSLGWAFAEVATTCLRLCVGQRAPLLMRLAWEERKEVLFRGTSDELTDFVVGAGMCSSARLDSRASSCEIELKLAASVTGSDGLARWFAECCRAYLETTRGAHLMVDDLHVEETGEVVRVSLSPRPENRAKAG